MKRFDSIDLVGFLFLLLMSSLSLAAIFALAVEYKYFKKCVEDHGYIACKQPVNLKVSQ